MKIIDLLNKIANNEELPKKFLYEGDEFYLSDDKCYRCDERSVIFEEVFIFEDLNDEVEVIKEEKEIPEKLKSLNNVGNVSNLVEFADKQQLNNHLLKDKLNEIVHYLQYLRSKGE